MIQIQHIHPVYVPCLKVDSHLAARLVVLWPPMAKVTIDKVKNVFQPKFPFFETYIKTRPGVNCAGVCSPQAKTV